MQLIIDLSIYFQMCFRAVTFSFCFIFLIQSIYAEDALAPSGFMSRITRVFHGSSAPADQDGAVKTKDLILNMELSPIPFKLSDTRQLKVVISLTNHSKKSLRLDFPTTQRFEILVRDRTGHQVVQWSEDQAFRTEPALITINPGEHIEYETSVATRDLIAGNEYVVAGFFPIFADLKIQRRIVPQK